jgi:hypothetical protein
LVLSTLGVAACALGGVTGDFAGGGGSDSATAASSDDAGRVEGGDAHAAGDSHGPCTGPTLDCGDGGACVDITTDPKNCGYCGQVCHVPLGGGPGVPTCFNAMCGYSCPSGSVACGNDGCWNTTTAHDHCGSCTRACALSEVCTLGQCCAPGDAVCGGACANLATDTNNCGGCGKACPGGQMCNAGSCSCPAARPSYCGGACTDTLTDNNNCGGCGTVCNTLTTKCVKGSCVGNCGVDDVAYNGHCYYLDGSKGACDPGYTLQSQSILSSIHSMFFGKTYKHTVSDTCCIYNTDNVMNWGMTTHCNQAGAFDSTEPAMYGSGCFNVIYPSAKNLTLCGK